MLPDPTEPLILADGTKINPVNGSVIKETSQRGGFAVIPSAGEAVEIVARTRRSIAELPMPSKQMNVVSLVLFYTMYGLNNQDIAVAIGGQLSAQQIKEIKKLPEYQQLTTDIKNTVLEHEANDIRQFFVQNASKAAEKIVALTEEEGALGFAASKDILDRAGFRAADIVEHRHKMEDSLKIEVIERKAQPSIPEADIEGEFINITPRGDD